MSVRSRLLEYHLFWSGDDYISPAQLSDDTPLSDAKKTAITYCT